MMSGRRSWVLIVAAVFIQAVSAAPSIVWPDGRLIESLAPGLSFKETVTFRSNINVDDDLEFVVSPELAAFIRIDEDSLERLIAGHSYTLTIRFIVPKAMKSPAIFRGTIQLRKDSRPLDGPLEVVISTDVAAARATRPQDIIHDSMGGQYAKNEILLTLIKGATLPGAERIAADIGGAVVGVVSSINTYQLLVPTFTKSELDSLLVKIRAKYGSVVGAATKHNILSLPAVNSDLAGLRGSYPNLTIAYDKILVEGAWRLADLRQAKPRRVVVGLLDTGVDPSHPEFSGVNIVSSRPRDLWQDFELNGHGTQVAGIIGANNLAARQAYVPPQMNGILSGLPGGEAAYTLDEEFGVTTQFKTWASIDRLTSTTTPIINVEVEGVRCDALSADQLSFRPALPCYPDAKEFEDDKRRWFNIFDTHRSALFVLPAGNFRVEVKVVSQVGDPTNTLPAGIRLSNTVTVGATDLDDKRAIWNFLIQESNFGPGVDIAAPGVSVYAPKPGGGYTDAFNGTSASAPMVSGIAALVFALDPNVSANMDVPAYLKSSLLSTGDPISNPGRPVGSTRANACRAVLKAIGPPAPQFSPVNAGQPIAATVSGSGAAYTAPLVWSSVAPDACNATIGYEVSVYLNGKLFAPASAQNPALNFPIANPSSLTGWTWTVTAVDPFGNRTPSAIGAFSLQAPPPPPLPTDLSITKKADSNAVASGGTLTYTLTVQNIGTGPAASAAVTDTLPSNVTLQSAGSTQGTCSGTTTITCALGNLSPNASAIVTIKVTAPTVTSPTTISNSGSVSTPGLPNKQTAPVVTTVNPPPPTCTLTATPPTITSGQSSTLSWTTTNNPTSGSIAPAPGSVNLSLGSINVSPTANTTYTLTVTNAGGNGQCPASVTVNPVTLVGPIPGPNVGDYVDLPLLVSPRAMALINSGTQALVSDTGGLLKTVDLSTKQVQISPFTPIPPFNTVDRIAVEGTGPTALIAHANSLLRVNYVTGQKTILASGFTNGPSSIAIEPGGLTVLVTDASGISRVTLSSGAVSLLFSVQANAVALEPSGTTALFLNGVGPCGLGFGIFRINLSTNLVTAVASPCSLRGNAIRIAPDGSFAVVVASPGDTGIAKIDLTTGAVTQLVLASSGNGSPSIVDLALRPDGSEVLSTWATPNGASIQRLRLSDNTLSAVTYGVAPVGLAVEAGGSTLLMTDATSFSSLYRLDIASGAPIQLTGAGANPPDLAALPGGQEVLVGASALFNILGDLLRINVSTLQVATVAPQISAKGIAPEGNGSTALVTIGSTLSRITLSTGAVTVLAQGLQDPWGVAIENPGQTAIVGSLFGVSRVNLGTGAVTPLTSVQGRYIAIESGGATALLSIEGGALSRLDLTTSIVTPLVPNLGGLTAGKVVIEAGGQTALLAVTSGGIKRVRIQ